MSNLIMARVLNELWIVVHWWKFRFFVNFDLFFVVKVGVVNVHFYLREVSRRRTTVERWVLMIHIIVALFSVATRGDQKLSDAILVPTYKNKNDARGHKSLTAIVPWEEIEEIDFSHNCPDW